MKQRKIIVTYLSVAPPAMSFGTTIYWIPADAKMSEKLYGELLNRIRKEKVLPSLVISGVMFCEEYRDK